MDEHYFITSTEWAKDLRESMEDYMITHADVISPEVKYHHRCFTG